MADWAEDSLLLSAFATPALAMQPEARSCPTTLEMLLVSAITLTLTDVECVNAPTLPRTVSVYVDGVTKGCNNTLSCEVADPPPGGVTGLVPNEAEKPPGGVGAVKVTAELKPFTEAAVSVEEPEPPKVMVIGEPALIVKSVTVSDAVLELPKCLVSPE